MESRKTELTNLAKNGLADTVEEGEGGASWECSVDMYTPRHVKWCMRAKSLPAGPTLCDPMDCSPPSSSVHGISQAKMLKWVAMPSSRGIFLSQGLNLCFLCLLHRQAGSLAPAPPGKPVSGKLVNNAGSRTWPSVTTCRGGMGGRDGGSGRRGYVSIYDDSHCMAATNTSL